jgi:quinol monooxygenase YgiN
MKNGIQYTIEWTIKNGGLEAFKKLANKATDMVRDNEPGMKGYHWYFNDDETKCYTLEWHSSSKSMLIHLQNVSDILPGLLIHSNISRFEVFGNPNSQALEAVKGLGADIFGYFDGFTR